MSAVLMNDRMPSEVGNTDIYNRLQMRSAVHLQDDPTGKTPNTAGEALRVLVVDDHRDSADVMSMLVSAWGHDVRRAYDAVTGLALAAAFQPNVLLLDIIMPEMSGLELTRQVRKQARLNKCFMIAVTGFTDTEHRQQCADAGIDLFLIKPVDPSILQTLLTLEFEYVLRSRQEAAVYRVPSTTLPQHTDPKSPRPTQLPCPVLPGTVAFSRGS